MNILDIIIIIPLLWAAYRGFTKGFIIEVATLIALALGIFGAIAFSNFVADILVKKVGMTSEYLPIISFAITFLIIVIAIHLLAQLLNKFVKTIALGWVNRIAGSVFCIVKFTLIIGVVLMIAGRLDEKAKFISEDTKQKSLLYGPLTKAMVKIFPTIESCGVEAMNELKELRKMETK